MKGFHLTKRELLELKLAHRRARVTDEGIAYKINTIILLGTGWKVQNVKDALLLDDETLRAYVNLYRKGGIEQLTKTNHHGSECRLADFELKKLCEKLDNSIYVTKNSIINFVQINF